MRPHCHEGHDKHEESFLQRIHPHAERSISQPWGAVSRETCPNLGQMPVAIGCDHSELAAETVLTEEQRQVLAEDFESPRE